MLVRQLIGDKMKPKELTDNHITVLKQNLTKNSTQQNHSFKTKTPNTTTADLQHTTHNRPETTQHNIEDTTTQFNKHGHINQFVATPSSAVNGVPSTETLQAAFVEYADMSICTVLCGGF